MSDLVSSSRISDEEAKHYYHGLPSKPRLIARTSTAPWEAPTGMEAYLRPKKLTIAGEHEIQDILHMRQVAWSSIDVVRIGYVNEPSGDLIVWIGAKPDFLVILLFTAVVGITYSQRHSVKRPSSNA
ncbi:hypothetical protein BDN72DRAFT_840681 [Pluteus cervinus]|uniref:Uncharacterized protein n=1 Tax=Pluteus cervinus TaxID=181527 RepID=A0ACD3AVC9_9AGAR|nr:hypothetical protein BDN72DRAFT_840681 [Pluteus cervinus]